MELTRSKITNIAVHAAPCLARVQNSAFSLPKYNTVLNLDKVLAIYTSSVLMLSILARVKQSAPSRYEWKEEHEGS